MEFSADNPVVKLCLQGLFPQAWEVATQPFERFMSAWFLASVEVQPAGKLKWLDTALQAARGIHDGSVKSALPPLHSTIAQCYEELGQPDQAQACRALAASIDDAPADEGPFFHGTRADLRVGDLLTPGATSNYQAGLVMNHIYFTALTSGAVLAAGLARGEQRARVYAVEPMGPFENDPNVTNRKFPGNLTRSYRSASPLRIIGEVTEWAAPAPEEIEKWRRRVASNKGGIIN